MNPYKDKIPFGKYTGLTWEEVAEIEPSYVIWAAENIKEANLPQSFVDNVRWDMMDEDGDMWGNGEEFWNG